MTYNKPEAVKLDNAVKAIQGNLKFSHVQIDNNPQSTVLATPSAYEADE